jgi:hypothetical protein
VALLTLPAKATVVNVIPLMTTEASGRHRSPILGRCGVAQRAGFCLVLSIQDELGPGIVIEIPVLPRPGVVALSAIGAQGLFVLVIHGVAGHTSDFGVPESQAFVTLPTLHRRVFPKQWKARQPVIESRHFPCPIVVALLALHAFLALMLVVLLVATETIQRRLSEAAQVFMASVALDSGSCMRIAQDKLGAVMAKTPRGGLPLILCMSVTAFLAQRRVVLVVLPMARQAFLGRLLEHGAFVTLLARGPGVFTE